MRTLSNPDQQRILSRSIAWRTGAALLLFALAPHSLPAASLSEVEELCEIGEYEKCIEEAAAVIEKRATSEYWYLVKLKAEMTLGRYQEALITLEQGLQQFPYSIKLRWASRDVHRFNGEPEKAKLAIQQIADLIRVSEWRYRDAASMILVGRLLLEIGADAKQVRNDFFAHVQKTQPSLKDSYIASGQLALAKHDYGLAAKDFLKAYERDEEDPEILFGLAQAFSTSEPEKAEKSLKRALEINPRHLPSLLERVDQAVDSEDYDTAEKFIQQLLEINPHLPAAHAYRVVLAHLAAQLDEENRHRDLALKHWKTNPAVDHLIGKKLSQKYRFKEGAEYQELALTLDPDYLPARMQLANDLLRLGRDAEGWAMAEFVFDQDNYNVVAYNLTTLRDNLRKFHILESDGFRVRMEAREAKIYGARVLEILGQAKQVLTDKYDVELPEPIAVEIFHKQEDFAIRTFGLPGGAGFLGVCFGNVITMNSPASQGNTPSNWEAVLWHEFCHVITLTKTKNKMPRWLSEGISVYEELERDSSWGQSMTPQYRTMILSGELTPVSELSGAFLSPKSPTHLMFAYYESALVVEYIVQEFGLEALKATLNELANGLPINDALTRHVAPIQILDEDFANFAKMRAEQLAPALEWTHDEEPPQVTEVEAWRAWLAQHPNSYLGLKTEAVRLIRAREYQAAKAPLDQLLSLFPEDTEEGNAHQMLARVHRELKETEEEQAVLSQLARLDADAIDVYSRLIELHSAEENWEQVALNAKRFLAVNPLLPLPHEALLNAAEALGHDRDALASISALTQMDPLDPADLYYRAARLHRRLGEQPEARRQVLMALEEAPRYRDAQRLLLAIVDGVPLKPEESANSAADGTEIPPPPPLPTPALTESAS